MRIEIDYFANADVSLPCGAQTEYQGQTIFGMGSTWEEARDKVVEKLEVKRKAKIPKREIVELPESEPTEGEADAAIAAAIQFEKEVFKRWQLARDNEKIVDEMMLDRDSLARQRDELAAGIKPFVDALKSARETFHSIYNNQDECRKIDAALAQVK